MNVTKMCIYCWYIYTFTFVASSAPAVLAVHVEQCNRTNTVLYVKSRIQTKSNVAGTVFPDGIVWRRRRYTDTMDIEFDHVRLGRLGQKIYTYADYRPTMMLISDSGRTNEGKVIKRINTENDVKNGYRSKYVRYDGPSAFVDYDWGGVDMSFTVQCSSFDPDADEDPVFTFILIGTAGIIVIVAGFVILLCSFIKKCRKKCRKKDPSETQYELTSNFQRTPRRTESESSEQSFELGQLEHSPRSGHNWDDLPVQFPSNDPPLYSSVVSKGTITKL